MIGHSVVSSGIHNGDHHVLDPNCFSVLLLVNFKSKASVEHQLSTVVCSLGKAPALRNNTPAQCVIPR